MTSLSDIVLPSGRNFDDIRVYKFEAFDGRYVAIKLTSKWHLVFRSENGWQKAVAVDLPDLEAVIIAYKEHYVPRLQKYVAKCKEELQ